MDVGPSTATITVPVGVYSLHVTGAPGDLIAFAPDVPLYSNVDHLLGTAVSSLEVQLCDQHGAELESLQDEHFSIVLCVQVDS